MINTEEAVRTSMHDHKQNTSCCPNMTPFILMIALSVHSIFEGLALGLQKDMSSTMNMVIAIVIHKGAASSSLGISLVKTFPDNFRLCRQLVALFACATPLGVGIGMLVSKAGPIYEIVFSSIAAGSFVYIACSEVVVEEFSIPGNRYWKLLAFLMGATVITLLWFLD
jgi:solute carrier family 39 (zinc transporter), member 1/2/3